MQLARLSGGESLTLGQIAEGEGISQANATLFMGACIALTAFPMLARIINERGLANTALGTLSLTAGAFDDAASWCVLALVLATFGAGPGVAELSFDHSLSGTRPAESFMVFAADKCGPGAYNLPLYLAFADPMYCAGLMLPPMIKGFRFHVIDMDNTAGDSLIELDAPADSYHIAALLRDNERFGIDRIISRTHGEVVVAVSAQRLHAIAEPAEA